MFVGFQWFLIILVLVLGKRSSANGVVLRGT